MIGSERRAQLTTEASFGGGVTGTATPLELVDEGLNVRPTKLMQDFPSSFGHPLRRRVPVGVNVGGPLLTLLSDGNREALMKLAFGGLSGLTDGTPSRADSYALQLRRAGISGSTILGVRSNSLAITAAAGQTVRMAYDLIAKSETKIAAPTMNLPTTLEEPYIFAGSYVSINGVSPLSTENIALTIANNLIPGPHRFNHNGTSEVLATIAYLDYGLLDVTGTATFKFDAETYLDLVRGIAVGSISLIFAKTLETDLTSGKFVRIDLPICHFPECPESVSEGVVTQALSFAATRAGTSATEPVTVTIGDTSEAEEESSA